MRLADIYQTLEERNNNDQVEKHGPYFCSLYDDSGRLKNGIKEPWLGEGYYFWDARINDAHWWGKTIYLREKKGYIVCHTQYDMHSHFLYDMVGDRAAFDDFIDCAQYLKTKLNLKIVCFPVVLEYLKKHTDFYYKAIRVLPYISPKKNTDITFPTSGATKIELPMFEKVQICFFDNTLLVYPYIIIEKRHFYTYFTI